MNQSIQSVWLSRGPRKLVFCFAILLFLAASSFSVNAGDRASEMVAYNVNTHKVHKLSCVWAERCTKNCITIKRADAYSRGGVACKVCGG